MPIQKHNASGQQKQPSSRMNAKHQVNKISSLKKISCLKHTISKINLLKEILQEHHQEDTTALAVGHLDEVVQLVHQWRQHLPNVKPFYAMKANPDPLIMRLLDNMGVNFDCASIGEMQKVTQLGVTPDRIIFANPVRSRAQILDAKHRGVKLLTFDSMAEADKLSALYPEAQLVLRILPTYSNASVKLDRYGCCASEQEELIVHCKKLKLNLIGVAFHVGSKCNDTESYSKVLKEARATFDLMKKYDYSPYFLDLGAGFHGTTFEKPTFPEVANVINSSLAENFGDLLNQLVVIAEPGRYFCSRVFTFALNIIGKKKNPSGPGNFYYTNDGVYGIMNFLVQHGEYLFADIQMDFFPEEVATRERVPATLFGPTCDSADCLCKEHQLPEFNVGDWLIMQEMGAYSLPTVTKFNDMPGAKRCYFISKDNAALLDNKKKSQKKREAAVDTEHKKFEKKARLSTKIAHLDSVRVQNTFTA